MYEQFRRSLVWVREELGLFVFALSCLVALGTGLGQALVAYYAGYDYWFDCLQCKEMRQLGICLTYLDTWRSGAVELVFFWMTSDRWIALSSICMTPSAPPLNRPLR